ncbi:MAG: hypothetical protein H0U39_12040 [Segetibacter sp.]|jgi:hypothetical protein|nr:hypothetical protein [Segetibacter sp.]
MPVSNDNQDYGESDKKNKGSATSEKSSSSSKSTVGPDEEGTLTSDNLKGKKVDADLEQEKDKPADV